MAPRTPALHFPMTSSMTKMTEEMGALNAAARPAAAPTGEISRTLSRTGEISRTLSRER